MIQTCLFSDTIKQNRSKHYGSVLTVSENGKGVLDVDTVKGCTLGMQNYPEGGCYGECYACKNAIRYGFDFSKSVSRKLLDREHMATIIRIIQRYNVAWYRIGITGDPCHDWNNTLIVCNALRHTNKIPVITTKHWIKLSDNQIKQLKKLSVVINTSTSGMDTDKEIKYRVEQINRLKDFGIRSICRVVTCNYGKTEWAKIRKEKQDYLMSLKPIIDNPFRVPKSNKHVINKDIITIRKNECIGGKFVSMHCSEVYLGKCDNCVDQCGVDQLLIENKKREVDMEARQLPIFEQKVEFEYVESVIGSGYEQDVSRLALEDGIAHRAARKNMQIHSAIILKINGEISGFFTFQNNDICKEFCLLQSTIVPDKYSNDLYKQMVMKVIEQNKNNYPAIMTTSPKSKFETAKLFNSFGFKTYMNMNGFDYLVYGELKDVRMKLLAHITMTNVWDSIKGDWTRVKKEWNEKIEAAGEKYNIPNPKLATREGCWQGESGFSNVVTGRSHNKNASVLDPTACEVILRFFIPQNGGCIYNPFGGGVQFGFVAGSYGYEYIASEIRQNQCDANNKLCSEFSNVRWIKSDSSVYEPDGMFDLVFTCPPYYRVEKYVDYDGNSPDGEINSLSTYEEFRDTLFKGYKIAIDHLNDDRFFVVMTGDSRDNKGSYHCHESETEIFLKESGLSVYNKIIYLESEFTRLAQAKKTLDYRKFPKREQKIIVAYKGNSKNITDLYVPIGRL